MNARFKTIGAWTLSLWMVLFCNSAWANGFFIQEMSGSGMAQAGAVVAAGDKPSNAFQNAANIAFIEGLHFELAGTTYIPTGTLEPATGGKENVGSDPIFVPHFFSSWKINDWLAVGVAEFTEFGLSTTWPDGWEGAHLVERSGLNSFTINPNVAFGPFEGFVVAVGFDAKWGQVDIKRSLTLGLNPAGSEDISNRVRMVGSTWGFGGNLGLMYQPAEWVRIGAAYRSTIKMKMTDGKADFTVVPQFASRFPDQNFDADIDLPHLVSAGVRFWPFEGFSVELDAWYTVWSVYDKLVFNFDKGLVLGPNKVLTTQTEVKDYHDAVQVRLGAEYKFYDDHLAVRGGFLYDGNPAPDDTVDPMMPDSDRIMPTIGFGAEWYGFYVDLGYMPVISLPRDVSDNEDNPLPAKFAFVTHDFSFSIGYHFDPFGSKDSSASD